MIPNFDLCVKVAALFAKFNEALDGVNFGPKGVLVATSALVIIAFCRILWAWLRAAKDQDFSAFASANAKMFIIWIAVASSPTFSYSLGSFCVGRGKAALSADGAVVTNSQEALNATIQAAVTINSLKAPLQERLSREWGASEGNAPDNLENFTNASIRLFDQTRARRKALNESKKAAEVGIASTDPTIKARSIMLKSDAEQGLAELETVEKAWKAARAPAEEANRKVAEGDSYGGRASTFSNSAWNYVPGADLVAGAYGVGGTFKEQFIGYFVIAVAFLGLVPAFMLAGSAILGVLSALISTLGQLLAYVFGLQVATSMSATIAPFAILSFSSESWSRFGWNWITFWLQALVSSTALWGILGVLATCLKILAVWAGTMSVGLQAGALPAVTAWDTFLMITVGALPLLALKILCGQVPTLMTKMMTSVVGPVSGHFHP